MELKTRQIIVAIVMLVEVFVFASAILMVFVMSAWMESDAFLMSATELDWWIEAAKRFVLVSLLSFIGVSLFWLPNKLLLSWIEVRSRKAPLFLSVIVLLFLFISSLAGSVIFAVTKPIM